MSIVPQPALEPAIYCIHSESAAELPRSEPAASYRVRKRWSRDAPTDCEADDELSDSNSKLRPRKVNFGLQFVSVLATTAQLSQTYVCLLQRRRLHAGTAPPEAGSRKPDQKAGSSRVFVLLLTPWCSFARRLLQFKGG